ncbi:MAG: RNA polymerase sigma factor [Myxococcaceae bacterium]|nr:RNA polymerase sigma factor [Myxococcaceae bacterium]
MSYIAPDTQRFESFVREHRPALLQLARRLCRHGKVDPEDLVQEALGRSLHELERLSSGGEAVLKAWLSTTLTNLFLDSCRRQRTEVLGLPSLRVVQEQAMSSEMGLQEHWKAISEDELRSALSHLKPRLRLAYEFHASGLRYREIAQKLGAPIGTVGSWISEARQELRQYLSSRKAES